MAFMNVRTAVFLTSDANGAAAANLPMQLGIQATESSAASVSTADGLNSIPSAHWLAGGTGFHEDCS